ncbi:hypothetical protein ACGRL8_17855 [Vibrio rumoiensis]|uniref:Uncharacterized protein n=1 Tax=Vibrio rumoiensis TaxID=76258 RepID=A0ABW7IZG0_9VIBR
MKGLIAPCYVGEKKHVGEKNDAYWKSNTGWKIGIWLLLILLTGCSALSTQPTTHSLNSDLHARSDPQDYGHQSELIKSASFISPEVEAMQTVERHCQVINTALDFPVYCQLTTKSDVYELDLSFSHYDSSQLYLMMLSHGLIMPYCHAVNLHQAEGHVVVTIFATQIQRQYDCKTSRWQEWTPIAKPAHSPFVVFLKQCRTWGDEHPNDFQCNVDWYEYVPILVFTFGDMKSVSELNRGQTNSFIQSFCQAGLKEFGEALYLLEVPSFNLAKMKHCGSKTETEWFSMDEAAGGLSDENII